MARNFKKHEENTQKYAAQIDDIQCAIRAYSTLKQLNLQYCFKIQ